MPETDDLLSLGYYVRPRLPLQQEHDQRGLSRNEWSAYGMLERIIETKRGMPYKARASWVRNCHSSLSWRRSSTWRRAVGSTDANRKACEMHKCHNGMSSSRRNVELDLESHVHGNRACVVWGRAEREGPCLRYLAPRLFHSDTPDRERKREGRSPCLISAPAYDFLSIHDILSILDAYSL